MGRTNRLAIMVMPSKGAVLWACILWAALPGVVSGQFTSLEGFMLRSIEAGDLRPGDADAIQFHIDLHGWPKSVFEASAIDGLSAEAAAWLSVQPEWRALCQPGPGGPSGPRLQARADFRADPQPVASDPASPLHSSFRIGRSGVWALRRDEVPGAGPHWSGHLLHRPQRTGLKGWQMLVGDHVLQWGQGLVGGTSSAFDGLRTPTAVLPSTRWVAPMASGPSLTVRRGAAAWWQTGPTRIALSSARASEAGWHHAAALQRHKPNGHWGAAMSKTATALSTDGWMGSTFFEQRMQAWIVAGEWAAFQGGWGSRLGAVLTLSAHLDAFAKWSRGHALHPGKWEGRTDLDPAGSQWMLGWHWKHPESRKGRTWVAFQKRPNAPWRLDLEWVHHHGGAQWTGRGRFTFPDTPAQWHLGYRRDVNGYRFRWRWDVRWDPWQASATGMALAFIAGLHPEGSPWACDIAVMRGHLGMDAPAVYVLEPAARGWRTIALRGESSRLTLVGRWKGRHLTLRGSMHWAQTHSAPSWGEGGADRFGLDLRLSYAM